MTMLQDSTVLETAGQKSGSWVNVTECHHLTISANGLVEGVGYRVTYQFHDHSRAEKSGGEWVNVTVTDHVDTVDFPIRVGHHSAESFKAMYRGGKFVTRKVPTMADGTFLKVRNPVAPKVRAQSDHRAYGGPDKLAYKLPTKDNPGRVRK